MAYSTQTRRFLRFIFFSMLQTNKVILFSVYFPPTFCVGLFQIPHCSSAWVQRGWLSVRKHPAYFFRFTAKFRPAPVFEPGQASVFGYKALIYPTQPSRLHLRGRLPFGLLPRWRCLQKSPRYFPGQRKGDPLKWRDPGAFRFGRCTQ